MARAYETAGASQAANHVSRRNGRADAPHVEISAAESSCEYWEATSSEIEYGTPSYGFKAWARARRDEACAAAAADAKKETDEAAAQRAAYDSPAAVAARAVAEQLRAEGRAWQAAHADACRSPTDEHACDGLSGYVKSFPDGMHAGEARDLLSQAEPLLTTMRQKREVETARAAKNEEKIGISLSNYRMQVDDPAIGARSSKRYLVATVDATVRRDQPPLTLLWARASCVVGDKRMVDEGRGFADDLSALNPGETKEVRLPLFTVNALAGEPSQCEVWFGVDRGLQSGGAIRGVCYTPHVRVAHGPCTWSNPPTQ